MDHLLEKELKKNRKEITFHSNPNFLLKKEDLDEFYDKIKGKKILHKTFYEFIKKKNKYFKR